MRRIIEHPHVEHTASVEGGAQRWHVKGTKVPVLRLWLWHRRGTTCEVLFKRYAQLGPARVLDALAFAYDNPDEMSAEQAALNEVPPDPRQAKLPF